MRSAQRAFLVAKGSVGNLAVFPGMLPGGRLRLRSPSEGKRICRHPRRRNTGCVPARLERAGRGASRLRLSRLLSSNAAAHAGTPPRSADSCPPLARCAPARDPRRALRSDPPQRSAPLRTRTARAYPILLEWDSQERVCPYKSAFGRFRPNTTWVPSDIERTNCGPLSVAGLRGRRC